MNIRRLASRAVVTLALAGILIACGSDTSKPDSTGSGSTDTADTEQSVALTELGIDPARCSGATVDAGSYFRMVQSGGTVAVGPFVANLDSTCTDKTYSSLDPGTDGGLTPGAYQPQPDPPFDAGKNGTADSITTPTKFFAVGFAVSTNAKDPATGESVPEPSITVDSDGKLTGDLSSVSVAWNGQQFNQGAPKPGGSPSATTTGPSGTYDAASGAYTLDWTSEIVGGPFNGFTGVWHLEGTARR